MVAVTERTASLTGSDCSRYQDNSTQRLALYNPQGKVTERGPNNIYVACV